MFRVVLSFVFCVINLLQASIATAQQQDSTRKLVAASPSRKPTRRPTRKLNAAAPTRRPTRNPTRKVYAAAPTRTPTRKPTRKVYAAAPTRTPTRKPTRKLYAAPPTRRPTRNPTRKLYAAPPTRRPTRKPTGKLNAATPTRRPTRKPNANTAFKFYPFSLVLSSDKALNRGDVISSPSGQYQFGLYRNGDLQLRHSINNKVIWGAGLNDTANCTMLPDGNVVTKNDMNRVTWQSRTFNSSGSKLFLDDGGLLFIRRQGSTIWFQGVPRGRYSEPSSTDLVFPLRGAFYYPWFPKVWQTNGVPVFYKPKLGKYSSDDVAVVQAHVDALEYAHVDVAIASWFGPESNFDRARIDKLLVLSSKSSVKWAIYHEMEYRFDPTVDQIRSDLDYLKKWFAWRNAYGHIDGRPIIFVYNENSGCDVASRWVAASKGEWFVVLKVFGGHMNCDVQPDSWHQYGPAKEISLQPGYSFSISPGFWKADESKPRLPRLSVRDWRANVLAMVNSKEDWQLITTFNEWGEGTSVETAQEWASASGYGSYLDALHDIH